MKRIIALLLVLAMALLAGCSTSQTQAPAGDTAADTADTAGGGRFSLDLSQAVIPDGFRTIYDVSVKAKNTAEPDWSRASPCTSMTGTP